MTKDEIMKLVAAGFTKDEIKTFAEAEEPVIEPAEPEAAKPETVEPAKPEAPDFASLFKTMEANIITAIQRSNLANATHDEQPEDINDILSKLVN